MIFRSREESFWQSISDLMAGLMVVFVFISISYQYQLEKKKQEYVKISESIHRDLINEFKSEELTNWGAEIIPEKLAVRFRAPRVLFADDSSVVKPEFKAVLKDFFPRYVKTIKKYDDNIVEVRIEGNASFDYNGDINSDAAYNYNMKLSQDRAFNVLKYLISMDKMKKEKDWMKTKCRANGASFSKASKNADASRYVEISIQRNAEATLKGM